MFFPWLSNVSILLVALVRKSSDLLDFYQTHNAATFSSKSETFGLQVHHALFCWTFFSCWRWNLVLFCQFTVAHFDLISNIFVLLLVMPSRTLSMKLLTWYRVVSQTGLFGSGRARLKFVKIFRACIQNFFIALGVTTLFFRDVDLLCSPR